jgi:acyl-coenzyme A thioesterase PaaI-like protein
VDTWRGTVRVPSEGIEQWGQLIARYREMADALAASRPPIEVMAAVGDQLAAISAELTAYQSPERIRFAGRSPGLPARGHPYLPAFEVDERRPDFVRGRVTFGPLFLGGNGAAHGGSPAVLFDDILGVLVATYAQAWSRTATLTVNYRQIAPVDTELVVEASVDRREGRKIWATARLLLGDALVTDAAGLFIVLRDDQP